MKSGTFVTCPPSLIENIIVRNLIHDNQFGFFVDPNCINNKFYYNEFYDNHYFNAKDLGTNNWDDGKRGNYWDDYEGEDADGDGIGDEPRPIPGNFNFDDYPIENRTKFPINGKPWIDQFDGPTSGSKGEKYGYAVVFFDDEYDDGYLKIDWDDETSVEFSDYIGAGEEYTFYHIWSKDGTYNVKVKAIDMFGEESDWETLEVSMPKQKNSNLFSNFLQKLIDLFPILKQILNPLIT